MTEQSIPRRNLGSTGAQVAVLGLGGFHQAEISCEQVTELLDLYLEADGNYVETARGYGGGTSERKLGCALQGRRERVILASKTGQRSAEGAWRELNESLEALQTDYLDLLIYHCVNEAEEVDTIAGPGGAGDAFARAREEGMVRFFAMSTHWPMTLLYALERLQLDAVMYWVNYLVTCNYPELYQVIAPAVRERGLGIIGMKPLGDGYLYRSVKMAFDHALAQEVDVLACGFNSAEMLRADLAAVCGWQRPTEATLEAILRDAPELGDTVCRQCGQCRIPELDTPRVFELEGKFDQQMFDGRPPSDAADYALRQRLRYWFNNQERAMELYKPYVGKVDSLLQGNAPGRGSALPVCPFGIDIRAKLRLAHLKLTSNPGFPRGVADF